MHKQALVTWITFGHSDLLSAARHFASTSHKCCRSSSTLLVEIPSPVVTTYKCGITQ